MRCALRNRFERQFRAIGTQIGCDKVLFHSYEAGYARYLSDFQDRSIKILEIGIGGENYLDGGQSLFLWKNLFPKAEIFGIDIYDKSKLNSNRVHTFVVDQTDAPALVDFAKAHGPFDVVIDDGSHRRADVLISLFALMPYVSCGGFYVIEDISTSYWPVYNGSSLANGFLDTPIDWVKKSIDIVNRGDILFDQAHLPGWSLRSVSAYGGLAFFEVGVPRISKNIPESSGFYENQRETDEIRYGKFTPFFKEFSSDAMKAVGPLLKPLDDVGSDR